MKKKISGIVFIILGIIGILLLEKFRISRPFSVDRFIIFSSAVIFSGMNIIFDYKKIWNFIYKKRYYIGIVLFIVVVARGYNGSSIYIYNDVIEPTYSSNDFMPIIGNARSIRSDEFLVDTPSLLSQYNHNKNFSNNNNALMARDTNVNLYPQLPTKDISILNSPRLIGFLFLPLNQAYSFYWYFPYFALFFSLFELFMILTKKNKILSLLGTIMLEFSPSLLWWNSTPFLLYGSLATIFFYHLFDSKDKYKKVLFAVLLGWMGSCYIMILYPAWQISYGYLFLCLFIYILITKKDKINWKDYLYLLISIMVIVILVVPTFMNSIDAINAMMSTEYPGARVSTGGSDWNFLYNYFSSIFYSVIDFFNSSEGSSYISLYPIPIILGIYICIKNKLQRKNNALLLCLTICGFLLSIWNYINIGVLAKLTLLSMSTPLRSQLTVSVICVFIIVELMHSYQTEFVSNKKKIISIIISFLFSLMGLYIVNNQNTDYMNLTMNIISGIMFTILAFLILINTKLGNKIFVGMMIIFGLFEFATIQPVNIGVDVLTKKPVAFEIQKMSSSYPDKVWVTVNSSLFVQSYLLSNGARVINSTNYYPNLELWKKFDDGGLYNEVYNRYAHIAINLTEEDTRFELLQSDLFRFYINNNDICKLDADYIASENELTQFGLNNIKLLYNLENIYLYELQC